MNKRKILFIIPTLCQGGLEHSLITALNLLDKDEYEISLLVLEKKLTLLPLVPDDIEVLVNNDNSHYFRKPKAILLQMKKSIYNAFGYKKPAKEADNKLTAYIHQQRMKYPAQDIVGNRKFDIVIAYAVGKSMETALYVKANKYFVFFHSSLDLHHDLLVSLFPRFDRIVAVNDGVKKMLIENYSDISQKVFVLYNYVDYKQIVDLSKDPIEKTIEQGRIILSTCGRISKEKGFDLAVKAAYALKRQGISFYWLFIGDGDERKKIEHLINEYDLNDYITITGYQDNPYPYMKIASIYVQPSYEEAQPLVLLEAMVLGKPIVSTKTVGGVIILNNGEKGVLTDFSGESLAAGILSLIKDQTKLHSFENLYSLEDNIVEKEEYIEKWNYLLSQ